MDKKLSIEKKKEIYNCKQKGESTSSLANRFGVAKSTLKYLIRLIDAHGFDILYKPKNVSYPNALKLASINRILIDSESIKSVAIELGLSSANILSSWVNKYIENGYTLIEKTKGRTSMKIPNNKELTTKELTTKELLEQKDEKILYLEAEIEYLKKLKALAQKK